MAHVASKHDAASACVIVQARNERVLARLEPKTRCVCLSKFSEAREMICARRPRQTTTMHMALDYTLTRPCMTIAQSQISLHLPFDVLQH